MFYVPTTDLNRWRQLLADPGKQWVPNYSAYELAHAWTQSDAFPKSVLKVFIESGLPVFTDIKILQAIPEHKVNLDTRQAPSQNDLFVLARTSSDIVTIMVEGKVKEPFGPTVEEWLENASEGKKRRLSFLMNCIELQDEKSLHPLRYQLLHRTASAILEAQNYHAKQALMLVHSFCTEASWLEDYERFVGLYGFKGEKNKIVGPVMIHGINLYFGWISDRPSNN